MLTEQDIKAILLEQHKYSLRFGDTAVKQGLIKPDTVQFFLQNLFPSQLHRERVQKQSNNRRNKITKDDITYWVTMSSEKFTKY